VSAGIFQEINVPSRCADDIGTQVWWKLNAPANANPIPTKIWCSEAAPQETLKRHDLLFLRLPCLFKACVNREEGLEEHGAAFTLQVIQVCQTHVSIVGLYSRYLKLSTRCVLTRVRMRYTACRSLCCLMRSTSRSS
jgi:hypothetical protein